MPLRSPFRASDYLLPYQIGEDPYLGEGGEGGEGGGGELTEDEIREQEFRESLQPGPGPQKGPEPEERGNLPPGVTPNTLIKHEGTGNWYMWVLAGWSRVIRGEQLVDVPRYEPKWAPREVQEKPDKWTIRGMPDDSVMAFDVENPKNQLLISGPIAREEPNLVWSIEGGSRVGRNPKTGAVVTRDAIPRTQAELEAIEERKQQRIIEAVARQRQEQREREAEARAKRAEERAEGVQATREGRIAGAIARGLPIEDILRAYGPSPFVAQMRPEESPFYRAMQPKSWTEGMPFQGYLAGVPGLEQPTGKMSEKELVARARRGQPFVPPIQTAWLTPEAVLAYKQKLLAAGYSPDEANAIWTQISAQSGTSPMLAAMTGELPGKYVMEAGRLHFVSAPGTFVGKPEGVGVPIDATPEEAAPFMAALESIQARREAERMEQEERARKELSRAFMPQWAARETRRRSFSQ